MRRLLYFDASSGVSGDMFVGALLDLGADFDRVRRHLESLGVPGLEVRARKVERRGVACTKFEVLDRRAGHAADDPRCAERVHHPRRGLREIRALIRGGALPGAVAEGAVAVFERLAEAEARVHGCTADAVHFHEVGGLDAIADVVSAASAFHALGIDEAWCSPVHVGSGTVRCAHGLLPVPAPAAAELLRGVPVYSDGTVGELATPTGAALLRHFCRVFSTEPPFREAAVTGFGAGTRDLGIPNVLRATLGVVDAIPL